MELGCGIYRDDQSLTGALKTINELIERSANMMIYDKSHVYNTELLSALELKESLLVAQAMVISALHRNESRGAHQRLDYPSRDDQAYLSHSLVYYQNGNEPKIQRKAVDMTHKRPEQPNYERVVPK